MGDDFSRNDNQPSRKSALISWRKYTVIVLRLRIHTHARISERKTIAARMDDGGGDDDSVNCSDGWPLSSVRKTTLFLIYSLNGTR